MPVQVHYAPINGDRGAERFERKFYLAPKKIGMAYGFLRQTCIMDSRYPSEQINSLYFDTADLDQHERSTSGDFKKDKVRIRWYGTDSDMNGMQPIFIELKSKQGFVSTKQRLRLLVPTEKLALDNLGKDVIPKSMLVDTLAGFGYYMKEMLQPVIKISYWRYRFNEVMTGQQVALDCHVCSTMIMPGSGNGERELELLGGIIEIKGLSMELPITLKRARMLDTDWTRFSKYSACIDSHDETPGSVGRSSPSGRIVRLYN